MNAPKDPDPWESCTFEGNERQQLQAWAKLSFVEKIEWLEEADKLAQAFAEARKTARPMFPEEPRPKPHVPSDETPPSTVPSLARASHP